MSLENLKPRILSKLHAQRLKKLTRITHWVLSTVSQQIANASVRTQQQQNADHQNNNEHEQNQKDPK